jgi:hypothetical protein
MRAFKLSRSALGIGVAAALLSACGGGSSVPVSIEQAFNGGATGIKHHQTFTYTGNKQTFTVPAHVTRLTVVARGAEGVGISFPGSACSPGFPGRVYAVIRVHPRDKLSVFVGGRRGFNGGGAGGFNGSGTGRGSDGGDASDVRQSGDALKDRIIVAAGGGGDGNSYYYCFASGGDGGGLDGDPGYYGGGGGTQTQGGAGSPGSGNGQSGGNGALGIGGNGGNGGAPSRSSRCPGLAGGGGGGGYYGGGGGGGAGGSASSSGNCRSNSDGGGGGSSYVEPSAITSRMWTGWRGTGNGNGQIIFFWK